MCGKTRGDDARKRLELANHTLLIGVRFRGVVLDEARAQAQEGDVVDVETGTALKVLHALNEKTRAGDEHDGNGDLEDDQRIAHARSRRPTRQPLRLEHRDDVRLARLIGGENPEEERRHQGQEERRTEDDAVETELEVDSAAHVTGSVVGRQRVARPRGDEESGGAANQREQDAFRQELPNEPRAAGAQRLPDRNLPATPGSARRSNPDTLAHAVSSTRPTVAVNSVAVCA